MFSLTVTCNAPLTSLWAIAGLCDNGSSCESCSSLQQKIQGTYYYTSVCYKTLSVSLTSRHLSLSSQAAPWWWKLILSYKMIIDLRIFVALHIETMCFGLEHITAGKHHNTSQLHVVNCVNIGVVDASSLSPFAEQNLEREDVVLLFSLRNCLLNPS